jgi:hypothetical protein
MGLLLKLRLYAYALGVTPERRDELIRCATTLVDRYVKEPDITAMALQLRELSRSQDEARFLWHAIDRRLLQRGLKHSTRSLIFTWLLQKSKQAQLATQPPVTTILSPEVAGPNLERDAAEREEGIVTKTSSAVSPVAATDPCVVVVRKVITDLQQIDDRLLGDESGLINLWEEICVQEQSERSLAWSAYDESVRSLIEAHLEDLSKTERHEIWDRVRQTVDPDSAEQLDYRRTRALSVTDVLSYLAESFVYVEAAKFSNTRTASFLENQ